MLRALGRNPLPWANLVGFRLPPGPLGRGPDQDPSRLLAAGEGPQIEAADLFLLPAGVDGPGVEVPAGPGVEEVMVARAVQGVAAQGAVGEPGGLVGAG